MADFENFILGSVAIASIPCAGIGIYTGNAWWFSPLIFTSIRLTSGWFARRKRTLYDDIMEDPELHEKMRALPNYDELMRRAKTTKSTGMG